MFSAHEPPAEWRAARPVQSTACSRLQHDSEEHNTSQAQQIVSPVDHQCRVVHAHIHAQTCAHSLRPGCRALSMTRVAASVEANTVEIARVDVARVEVEGARVGRVLESMP